ncbi:MAG: DUF4248 domain-containing protein [Bacteroides sp.]
METEERAFILKAYTKEELAELYYTGADSSGALQNLYRWIKHNTALLRELEAVGYNKHRHSFMKREVALIVKYLGEP